MTVDGRGSHRRPSTPVATVEATLSIRSAASAGQGTCSRRGGGHRAPHDKPTGTQGFEATVGPPASGPAAARRSPDSGRVGDPAAGRYRTGTGPRQRAGTHPADGLE